MYSSSNIRLKFLLLLIIIFISISFPEKKKIPYFRHSSVSWRHYLNVHRECQRSQSQLVKHRTAKTGLFGARQHGFKSPHHHLLALWPQASFLIFWCLRIFTYKVETTTGPLSETRTLNYTECQNRAWHLIVSLTARPGYQVDAWSSCVHGWTLFDRMENLTIFNSLCALNCLSPEWVSINTDWLI